MTMRHMYMYIFIDTYNIKSIDMHDEFSGHLGVFLVEWAAVS